LVRWVIHRVAHGVARYPRLSLVLVIGYVGLSFFELIPIVEAITDFMVILSYLLLLRYIKRQKTIGQPL
jgi:hypothetical protein